MSPPSDQWKLARRVSAVLAACCLFGSVETLAQQASMKTSEMSDLAIAHQTAMQAFNAGNWAAAAEGLEKVIAMVTDPKDQLKIGAIHYTLGAAYFNAANYPKAVAAFKTFLAKFPTDERVGDARLALARATFLSKDYAGAAPLFAQLEALPAFREQALLVQAECFKQLNKPDDQIRILEKLIAPDIKTSAQANGALTLVQLHLDKIRTTRRWS